jgi:serine/threonine protein kinase
MSTDSPIRSARFTLTRELGSGGFGVVHLAHDRERNEHVALKVLKELNADSLYRFKNEFRSLADIIHPNLVSLHELVCESGQWFFTMELIEGVDFLTHVFGGKSPGFHGRRPDVTLRMEAVGESGQPEPRPVPADLGLLRPALRQLVEGVAALHASGKLHCDIKPANVMVAKDGRVVLLDFGLVKELYDDPARSSQLGTPMYMAPEQIQGLQLTEATDWYSVGVLLYQALTGKNPYPASERVVLTRKQTEDPPPPKKVVQDVPDDLNRICMAMLARDPTSRPKDAEVVKSLAGIEQISETRPAPLLGRQRELQVLAGTLDRVKSGQMVVVHTFGHSGMGKTTLLQHFTDEVKSEDVVVLKGRCFEQESVPYNALDSLMDSLCWYLGGLPRQIVLELIPEDIDSLTQLFPVLKSVHAVADSLPTGDVEIGKTLVLLLDDLQWGDVDSAALLRSLVKPPGAPRILVLASYRTEGIDNSPLVQGLRSVPQESGESEHLDLQVGELSREASLELVRTLLAGKQKDQRCRDDR